MAIEIKGKLIKKMDVVSGEGKNGKWEKQEFVIETEDQYPKKICMSVWGDKLSMLEHLVEGDIIRASVNIESREYNSRWYTDIRAWRIDKEAEEGSSIPHPDEPPPADYLSPEDDLPF
ncbi:MAG: hypothetical protein C0591_11645 [Marinilabiliales bacterium]|jgi:hypothetical protein|nr:MAG: hypothetical protein C0591_11645 [Marinilabiliales bacterium]